MTDSASTSDAAASDGPHAAPDRAKWILFLIVAVLSLAADQATKIWARDALPTVRYDGKTAPCVVPDDMMSRHDDAQDRDLPPACHGKAVPVIDGFWKWRLSMNPGSAFGLFSSRNGARIGLSFVGVIAVFGMLWMLKKARRDQRILHWALALVAGGAVGNLIDRIYYGVVTDFVLWYRNTFEWPVFNVADVVLVVGVALMFIDIQKEAAREKRLKAGRQSKAKAAGLVKM